MARSQSDTAAARMHSTSMPDESQSDEQLLAGARDGDSVAFRALVERYEGKVAATVRGMLGNDSDADDVGQETFLLFHRSLSAFRGEAAIGTYVTRIAINQCLKLLRKRKTWRERFFAREEELFGRDEPSVDAERLYDERERAGMVRTALQTLGPDHRAVVVLRIMEGYSTRETAELLGIPQGTVMSRLTRSLEKLGAMLGGEGGRLEARG